MRRIYFIDLFCGAGGFTSGAHRASYMGMQFAHVIACVNHDPLAIASHEENHPDAIHYIEDIRFLDLTELRTLVEKLRREDPDCLIFIWASLECTNFSKAKGGLPRKADSRTLANHMHRYVVGLRPDGIWIENVEEFMSWGPLDENGKPISKRAGQDYIRWVKEMQGHGYNFDYRILNAADFGAYTSRRRYFAQFMAPGIPIAWPEPTHAKNVSTGNLLACLEKWKAVKDVLDFSDEGQSIYARKKPLSEKTLVRIYAGLIKYVAGGKDAFIAKYYSGNPLSMVIPVDGPAGTVRTVDGQALVQTSFLANYYSSGGQLGSVDGPACTISTKDRTAMVQTVWLNKRCLSDITGPRKWSYLVNPSWGGHPTGTDQPSPVIIARGDKAPMYMVMAQSGVPRQTLIIGRSVVDVRIRWFMAAYGIVDIKMRMLKILEMLRIQGFGDSYVLKGNQGDQKRFIGNAVEVNQAKVLIEASYAAIIQSQALKTA